MPFELLLLLALQARAQDEPRPIYTCVCTHERCGDGPPSIEAANGAVLEGVTGDLSRPFGLSREGYSAFTGWTCAASGSYACRCEFEECVGWVHGRETEEHKGVPAARAIREFHKYQQATGGWVCRLTARLQPPPPKPRSEDEEPEFVAPKRSSRETLERLLREAREALKAGRADKALDALELALTIRPDEPSAIAMNAEALAAIGDDAAAAREKKRAKKLKKKR